MQQIKEEAEEIDNVEFKYIDVMNMEQTDKKPINFLHVVLKDEPPDMCQIKQELEEVDCPDLKLSVGDAELDTGSLLDFVPGVKTEQQVTHFYSRRNFNTFRTEPVCHTLRYISCFLMKLAICITFFMYSNMVFSSLALR
ncbi:hypothetical protein C0J52_10755 [Blattella germanica]|nr:hypothetical protein C0J52_10755 [Blattella germanica]